MRQDANDFTRRQFLGMTGAGAAALLLPWGAPLWGQEAITLVKVTGGTPAQALQAALETLGALANFAPSGKVAAVKPNIGWDRTPEQAANTDPELVAAVVRAFKTAGSKVQVFDYTCNAPERCYRRSGIEAAARSAGADVALVHEKRFDAVALPTGESLRSWRIYRDWLRADLRINVPILKHHGLAGVTMGLKNLMGVMGGNRSTIHEGFATKIVDIAQPILPHLTILDARRVLVRNGPTGGSLDDVRLMDTLIAGFDPVAVDAEGARLFDLNPSDLDYLVTAQRRGLGSIARPAGFKEIRLV